MVPFDPQVLQRVQRALSDIRDGKMVILVDDEDRENEGDLVMAADFVTPSAINFMAMHGRGLICLTLTEEQVDRLDLPMMHAPGRKGPPLGTAFTVSIEARTGVSTGISAHDRAHTIRVASRPSATPQELVTPGHVFPLRARTGGVLVRTGQTEGSVDLARLAGLTPAGVICEIMNEDGSMARLPDLEKFAEKHDLPILAIADLIQYRLATENLVRKVSETDIRLDATGSTWRGVVFESLVDARQLLALLKGTIAENEPTLCRVHAGSLVGDLFASTARDGGRHLREAISTIEAEGKGIVLYIPSRVPIAFELQKREPDENDAAPLREFGLGAQVLRALSAKTLRLLTNNPRKIAGIHGFGLDVLERVPLCSKHD